MKQEYQKNDQEIKIEKDQGVLVIIQGERHGKPFSFQIVTNIHAFGVPNMQEDLDGWLNQPKWRMRKGWTPESFCSFVNRRKRKPFFTELYCVTKPQF